MYSAEAIANADVRMERISYGMMNAALMDWAVIEGKAYMIAMREVSGRFSFCLKELSEVAQSDGIGESPCSGWYVSTSFPRRGSLELIPLITLPDIIVRK